jgi:parallel beta-helix repeat protein
MDGADSVLVRGNTFSGNGTGLSMSQSQANAVYQNDFIGNLQQVALTDPLPNVFNMPAPSGGNYWSDFDEPVEDCQDMDGDGFCDAPYTFPGAQDELPWTEPDAWCSQEPVLGLLMTDVYWDGYADYISNRLSVEYQVESFFDVTHGLVIVGTSNTMGVTAATPMPHNVGDINGGGGGARTASFTLKYNLPTGTPFFANSIYATAMNGCGTVFPYPGPSGNLD